MGRVPKMNGENRLFLMRNRRSRLQTLNRHSTNLRHVIMSDGVCVSVSVIPCDGNSAPSDARDRAKIGGARFPANAVANAKLSGFVAGHCIRFPTSSSTRQCHAPLATAFLAWRRIDSATRLCWLLHFGKSSAVASGAFDFCNCFFWPMTLHKIRAPKGAILSVPSTARQRCRTDLSHKTADLLYRI
jgi:hypothetical protein